MNKASAVTVRALICTGFEGMQKEEMTAALNQDDMSGNLWTGDAHQLIGGRNNTNLWLLTRLGHPAVPKSTLEFPSDFCVGVIQDELLRPAAKLRRFDDPSSLTPPDLMAIGTMLSDQNKIN
jgi:hypothetical protein